MSDWYSGDIYEYTPNGTQSTFASGLNKADKLAFNSIGDLFVADQYSDNIYKFTPNGTRSTFAAGLYGPSGLAFNSSGDLYEADYTRTTFTSSCRTEPEQLSPVD